MFILMDINIAAAKPRLSELVERAEKGEVIRLARRGKAVVEMRQINPRQVAGSSGWKDYLDNLRPEIPVDADPDTPNFVEEMRRKGEL